MQKTNNYYNDYQTLNIYRNESFGFSNNEQDKKTDYQNSLYSIYSDENYSDENYSDEQTYQEPPIIDKKEYFRFERNVKEEKVISDIISFYTNGEPVISELISLPISPENLKKLKNQWNKEDKFSMKINKKEKKEKTVWKRISDSFKKQSSPKRSLYDILTK